jgi:hypothetical protein
VVPAADVGGSVGVRDDRSKPIGQLCGQAAKGFETAGADAQTEAAVERSDEALALQPGDYGPVAPAERSGVGRAGVQPQPEGRLVERKHHDTGR